MTDTDMQALEELLSEVGAMLLSSDVSSENILAIQQEIRDLFKQRNVEATAADQIEIIYNPAPCTGASARTAIVTVERNLLETIEDWLKENGHPFICGIRAQHNDLNAGALGERLYNEQRISIAEVREMLLDATCRYESDPETHVDTILNEPEDETDDA